LTGETHNEQDDELIVSLSDADFNHLQIALYHRVEPGWPLPPSAVTVYDKDGADQHVTAMTTGDYDGNGTPELIIATSNRVLNQYAIFRNETPTRPGDTLGEPISGSTDNFHVAAMTSGDFIISTDSNR